MRLIGTENIGGTAFHVYRLDNGHIVKTTASIEEIERICETMTSSTSGSVTTGDQKIPTPNCDDCKHAVWKRTSNGRLHPDKTGRCGFEWTPPPMPIAFWTGWGTNSEIILSGGYIERGATHKAPCPCFAKAEGR